MNRNARRLILLILLLTPIAATLVVGIMGAGLRASTDEVARSHQPKPLEPYLNADGTLNLSSAWERSAFVRGYQMESNAAGAPRFLTFAQTKQDTHAGNYVYALAFNGEQLVAGGVLEALVNADGSVLSAVHHVASWQAGQWHALGRGLSGPVYAMAMDGDDLYLGGNFRWAFHADGTAIEANHIVRWDGTRWHALGPGLDGPVEHLQIVEGKLYASGSFTGPGDDGTLAKVRWSLAALSPGFNAAYHSIQQALAPCRQTPVGAAAWVHVMHFVIPETRMLEQRTITIPRLARYDALGWTLVGVEQSASGACGTSYLDPIPTPTPMEIYLPFVEND